jgi:hypothetical protein
MVLQRGEKLHIIARRLFESEARRHLVGQVEAVSDTALRVIGYAFVLDKGRNEFVRRPEKRTRIFPLADIGLVINVLPEDLDLDAVYYGRVGERTVIADGESFTLDVHEFGPTR